MSTASTQNLTSQTTRGASWMLASSIASKVASFAGQIAIAYLLSPADIGLFFMAAGFVMVATVLKDGGVLRVLITRGDQIDDDLPRAFWLCLLLGMLATVCLVVLGPTLATHYYKQPEVAALILVMAIATPFQSISVIPQAKLQSSMKFRAVATIGALSAVATILLSVVFAVLGMGPMSYALPIPIVAIASTAVLFRMCELPPLGRPTFRGWGALISDSKYVLGVAIIGTLAIQGDRIILGGTVTPEEVGLYSFAFGLSMQVISIISLNLSRVLLPTLSTLQHDTQRQSEAFFRSMRSLAVIAIPTCMAMAFLAEPLLMAIFPERWAPAAPLLAILATATAVRSVGWGASDLIQSQKRFPVYFLSAMISCCIQILLIWLGAVLAGAMGAAAAILVGSLISAPIMYSFATRSFSGAVRFVQIISLPILSSFAAFLPAVLVWDISQHTVMNAWFTIVLGSLVAVPIFLTIIAFADPRPARELIHSICSILPVQLAVPLTRMFRFWRLA